MTGPVFRKNSAPPRGEEGDEDVMDAFHTRKLRLPPCAPSRDPWARAGIEPRLEEVLADPLVHQVMRRDGVTEAALRGVIDRAQARRPSAFCCRCAA
jgi:hypothetical protein